MAKKATPKNPRPKAKPGDKQKGGRPTDYCQETVDKICERMGDGMSVREICIADDVPDKATVFRWLGKHEEFRDQYARASESRTEHIADEMLDIADNGENDWMERQDSDGVNIGWQTNGEAIQRSRLRIDARKWLLSKMLPKKYGDKITQEHTGANGGPIKTQFIFNPVGPDHEPHND